MPCLFIFFKWIFPPIQRSIDLKVSKPQNINQNNIFRQKYYQKIQTKFVFNWILTFKRKKAIKTKRRKVNRKDTQPMCQWLKIWFKVKLLAHHKTAIRQEKKNFGRNSIKGIFISKSFPRVGSLLSKFKTNLKIKSFDKLVENNTRHIFYITNTAIKLTFMMELDIQFEWCSPFVLLCI